jgi:hypothetical protein
MNFLDTWQELEEIYNADFDTTGTKEVIAQKKGLSTGLLYHFYADLSDLLNSLENGVIYSTKNDKAENKAQFDYSDGVGDGTAYVCMTHTLAGKTAAIKDLGRPFGLSFKAKDLAARGKPDRPVGRPSRDSKKRGHTVKAFDAWGAKGNYDTSSRGNPYLLAQTEEQGFNPFNIQAVGELPGIQTKNGTRRRFFISGGQSNQGQWSAKIFYNTEVYEKLRDWFKTSYETGEAYQRRMFYHFKNGEVGSPKQSNPNAVYKGKLIDVDGNLNANYKPFAFKTKDGTISYTSSIAFEFSGDYKSTFVEVIGYGPFQVKEEGKKLLALASVNADASGTYRGPHIFGKNINTNSFYSDKTEIRLGQGRDNKMVDGGSAYSIQQHLMADEKLFKELSAIYDEHEYRIYLPNSSDFRFKPDEIETLVLPEAFWIAKTKEEINIAQLVKAIEAGVTDLDKLKANGIIKTRAKKVPMSPYLTDIVTSLIELLQTNYSNVGIEIIPNTSGSNAVNALATIGTFQKTGEADVGVPLNKDGKIPEKDHIRKITDEWPDLSPESLQVRPGEHDEDTIVAKIQLPGNIGISEARIGSEAIIIAEDEAHNKYVLFVYKSKSPMFMELPGGGFGGHKPSSPEDFKKLLMDKLEFKCNLCTPDITTPEDTGKALLLHEVGVAKTKDVTWPWSYYRLYTAKLKDPLSDECLAELGYTFDNAGLAASIKQKTGIDVHSYRAHMRWVPIKNITLNRAVTDRYSNIIPLIKAEASKY